MARRLKASDAFKRLGIPPDAEKIMRETVSGALPSAYYRVDGEIVALITWNQDGTICSEMPIRHDMSHGVCREWGDDGQLIWECRYVRGREHGVIRQWSPDGRLLGLYKMVHGTGHDLWFDDDGRIAEECYRVAGHLHGLERRWDGRTLYRECFWKDGYCHGIEREWRNPHRLARGYPGYYVAGERVSKRQYLRAAQRDPTLPAFREQENHPRRRDRPGEAFWNPDASRSADDDGFQTS